MHQTHFCKKGENYLYYKKKTMDYCKMTLYENICFDNLVVSSLWISEFVSQLSVFSRRISFQLVKKPTEIKLVIISDNLRNLIDGIGCCFK